MRHRFLTLALMTIAAVSVIAIPVAAQAPARAPAAQAPKPAAAPAAKAWTPPKTSWGDPDLQGIYTSDDYIGLGLNRQAQYGTRQYLTDEEIAARERTIQATAERDAVESQLPAVTSGRGLRVTGASVLDGLPGRLR